MRAACKECGRTHSSDMAVAVGRFNPTPSGYRAAGDTTSPLRATRAEAEHDACAKRVEPYAAFVGLRHSIRAAQSVEQLRAAFNSASRMTDDVYTADVQVIGEEAAERRSHERLHSMNADYRESMERLTA